MRNSFAERLANVRHRFVSALEGKIEDSYEAIPALSGATPFTVEVVGETYRRVHNIVGIGPTVGFAATGRAARAVESILMAPLREARGLTAKEMDAFKTALRVLREAAARELQSFYSEA